MLQKNQFSKQNFLRPQKHKSLQSKIHIYIIYTYYIITNVLNFIINYRNIGYQIV